MLQFVSISHCVYSLCLLLYVQPCGGVEFGSTMALPRCTSLRENTRFQEQQEPTNQANIQPVSTNTVEPPSKGHFGTNINSGHLSFIEGLSLFGGAIFTMLHIRN